MLQVPLATLHDELESYLGLLKAKVRHVAPLASLASTILCPALQQAATLPALSRCAQLPAYTTKAPMQLSTSRRCRALR